MEPATDNVCACFPALPQAVKGEIVLTPKLMRMMDAIFATRPPQAWIVDETGAEISWLSASLAGLWRRNHTNAPVALHLGRTTHIFSHNLRRFCSETLPKPQGETCVSVAQYRTPHPASSAGWWQGLQQRHAQLSGWLAEGVPKTFWLAGFFNPQGFLTSVRQDITRLHHKQQWALDDVVLHTGPWPL